MGFCIELHNDAAWASSFLLANDVCNLQMFVDTYLVSGLGGGVQNISVDLPDLPDRNVAVTMSSHSLSALRHDGRSTIHAGRRVAPSQDSACLVGDSANFSVCFTARKRLRLPSSSK